MYDTIKVTDFDKEGQDYYMDLEVDVSFDLTHNGVENVSIQSVWDVTSDDPKEIELKTLTQDEIADLKARIEMEMFEKQTEYEHDHYLSQVDDAYDDYRDDVG